MGKGVEVMKWTLHGGVYRSHPYRVIPQGKFWDAFRNNRSDFPYKLGRFETEEEAKSACFDDSQGKDWRKVEGE